MMHKIAVLPFMENSGVSHIKHPGPIWKRRCDLQGQTLKAGWIYSLPYVYFEGRVGDPRATQYAQSDRNLTHKDLTGMFYNIAQEMAHHCNFTMSLKEVNERLKNKIN